MSEPVSFWLDNKNCAGTKAAAIGDQVLVLYRDRYYIVTDGAAHTRGGRPVRFSTTSLPSDWKRALKGDAPSTLTSASGIEPEAINHPPKRQIRKAEKPSMSDQKNETPPEKGEKPALPVSRAPRKTEAQPVIQASVIANCPYCSNRNEIPVEKGKSGKPFFIPCSKCKKEFAVRFVPVTMFQAQVAGFR